MLQFGDLRDKIPEAVGLLLGLHSLYLVAVWFALRHSPPRWLVAVGAIAFRLTLAPQAPSLSDDLYRYSFEGQVQSMGANPYAVRPADPPWNAIAHQRTPGADFRAVYGPLTELTQWAAWRWPKVPAMLADLVVLLLLARWMPGRWLIYAWSPLPVLEFWGQGHNDALVVLFLVLALYGRENWAGMWLGWAAAVKWWPLALLAAFQRQGRVQWRDYVLAPAVVLVLLAWYLPGLQWTSAQFLSGFLGGWRNNDSVYGLLLGLVGDVYRAKYLAFALFAAASLLLRQPLWVVVAMLAVSANVHPWYLSWLLPFLVRQPVPGLMLWIALMPLAYETVIWWHTLGLWTQSPEVRYWIYLPVAAVLVASWWLRPSLRKTGPRLTSHAGTLE
ncbi:MAG: hypothetical protein NTV70_16600 [Acidobacteria bacterium]|nr:hypothetical protein [Acidobacteriota bacterium]